MTRIGEEKTLRELREDARDAKASLIVNQHWYTFDEGTLEVMKQAITSWIEQLDAAIAAEDEFAPTIRFGTFSSGVIFDYDALILTHLHWHDLIVQRKNGAHIIDVETGKELSLAEINMRAGIQAQTDALARLQGRA